LVVALHLIDDRGGACRGQVVDEIGGLGVRDVFQDVRSLIRSEECEQRRLVGRAQPQDRACGLGWIERAQVGFHLSRGGLMDEAFEGFPGSGIGESTALHGAIPVAAQPLQVNGAGGGIFRHLT
jgi:hypothetical protein